MNVEQLRDRIERELVHAPDVRPHRDEILDRLNDALRTLMAGQRWPFRSRLREMRLKAEVSLTAAQLTTNAGGNTYAIAFSQPATWDAADRLLLDGHTWEFTSPSTGEVTTYVIERVTAVAGVITVILDPRYTGHPSLVGDETAKIKFLRYALPRDCEDIYSLLFRGDTDAIVKELTLAQEQDLLLNPDDSPSLPDALVRDTNRAGPYPTSSGQDYPHDFIAPPSTALTLTPSAGGALKVGGAYEYRYAWSYGGITGPPSPISRLELSGANRTIALTDFEVLDSSDRGRTRLIYRRENEGPWYLFKTLLDPTVASESDPGAFTTAVNPTSLIREREYLSGGSPWFVRTWPLTDVDRAPTLRYLAGVARLDNDGDVPEYDEAFHDVLVHMVVMEMALSHDAPRLAVAHERLLNHSDFGRLTLMKRRLLGTSSSRHQRRSVLRDEGHFSALVHGPVTLNG